MLVAALGFVLISSKSLVQELKLRKLAIAIVVTGTLLSGRSGLAGEVKDSKSSVEVLLRAERLDDSAVGYAGERTVTYDAFSQLYKAGKASTDDAKHLIADATPEGRVYGLLILRHIAPADAEMWTKRMLLDRARVTVMNGCLIHHSTVGELVAKIQGGESIISLPR